MSHIINEGPWATTFRKGLRLETSISAFLGGSEWQEGRRARQVHVLAALKLGEYGVVELCHHSVQRIAIEVGSFFRGIVEKLPKAAQLGYKIGASGESLLTQHLPFCDLVSWHLSRQT